MKKLCRMHRNWINKKDFVTDIVFCYTITACQFVVVASGKTSAGSLFYHISQSCKCQWMKIKWRYFVPKIINFCLDLLEYLNISLVRNFSRHSVDLFNWLTFYHACFWLVHVHKSKVSHRRALVLDRAESRMIFCVPEAIPIDQLSGYYNCDSTSIRLRFIYDSTTTIAIKITIRLRFDFDSTRRIWHHDSMLMKA